MPSIKNIRQSILKKSEPSVRAAFFSGYFAVILQCLLIREFLSIFFGNELILGILFSIWLLFSGIGSFWGTNKGIWHYTVIISIYTGFALTGIYLIRIFPTLFEPGSVIPTHAVAILFVASEGPVAFCTGYIFGTLSRHSSHRKHIYLLENGGTLIGALVVSAATLVNASNSAILIAAIVPLPLILLFDTAPALQKKITTTALFVLLQLCAAFVILTIDTPTTAWKYAGPVSHVRQTREGELALLIHETDTTLLLNNSIYTSTYNKEIAEQAVHIPAAQREQIQNVLVIFDRGYYQELMKYNPAAVDIIEVLPDIASERSTIIAPEKYSAGIKFDLILLGSSLPRNTATSRFYTVSFFNRMRSLMTQKAVFSFTLPFNESYMPPDERTVYDILYNTLASVFSNVLVFPGNGYMTFMASEDSLHIPSKVDVETEYLSAFVLPSLSDDKITRANTITESTMLNTITRPIALLFSLKTWMKTFGFSVVVLSGILITILVLSILLLPKNPPVLSVATSGFATGLYSVGLMLLYQATYGSLYAEISLLLMALSLGFVTGSKMPRLPFSDLSIGIYCIVSFILLSALSQPPVAIFFLCHFGIGFLSAAQFVTRKDASPGIINTADLIGGVFGMAISSTLLIPLFGIVPVMAGIFVVKTIVEISNKFFC